MNLLESLKLLQNDNLPQKEFNSLINYSISTALSFLNIKQSYKYFNLTDDVLSLSDIASEAIVPLFVKSGNGKLGIVNSFEQRLKPITNETEATFFIHKIVMSRVEQTIPIKLKERDPFFGKILSSVSTTLRDGEFLKISYLGTAYITYSKKNNLTNKNIIPYYEFGQLPTKLFLLKHKKLVKSVLNYLDEKTEYFPAIPLNRFIKKIKTVLLSELPSASTSTQNIPETLFVKEMLASGLEQIRNDILTKYVKTKKLTGVEGNAITKSFEIIVRDLQNGGMHSGLFSYVKEQIPELSSDDFYSKYHGIVKYLLDTMRNDILKRWNY